MFRNYVFGAAIVAMMLAIGSPAFADSKVVITAATVDAGMVKVEGFGFRPRSRDPQPVVMMGVGANGALVRLSVAAGATDKSVSAQLPSAIAAGAYRLFVIQGDDRDDDRRRRGRWDDINDYGGPFSTIDVTIGASGPMGPMGFAGPQGVQGAMGPMGPQGPQGPAGPAGPTGARGFDGKDGRDGKDGMDGAPGATGPQGLQGPAGPAGPAGAQGPQGPQGPMGPQGIQGAQGPAGPQGPPATGPIEPNLGAAIAKEIAPINVDDLAMVELTTVVTYPYQLELLGVQTLNGVAPVAFSERDAGTCPNPSESRGLECRQRFQLWFSYDTCQFIGAKHTVNLGYTTRGMAGENITITLNSANWCDETPVSLEFPSITSMTPNPIIRGQAATLVIDGHGFAVGDPAIQIKGVNFTPTTITNNRLTLSIPSDLFTFVSGPVAVKVLTGAGESNTVMLNLVLGPAQ